MDIKNIKNPTEWKEIFNSEKFEKEYHYAKNDLGNIYTKEKTIFKIWAPTATKVQLNLYSTGSDLEENAKNLEKYTMEEQKNGVWFIEIKKDLKNIYYTYTVEANGETNETNDINAKACGINSERSMIIDFEETNPKDWEKDSKPEIPIEERIIYELHIKDFSNDKNSGIDEKYRGKYLAFTQNKTTLKQDKNFPTCIEHLKKLGITYVHILPFYDFASIDEKNEKNEFNWGYDPVNYNVPEGSYSTNPYDGKVRIKEVKEMIKALHSAGIGVIMDVVYNHTYKKESNFNKTVPYYYYRIDENGEYSDGSACGNETASEHSMYREYMIDSILYWAKEYHIDGFRFDLMGIHDTNTMNKIRQELDNSFEKGEILIYGEPWAGGKLSLKDGYIPANKENLKFLDENISAFCDITRDLIKGSVFVEKDLGYINGNKQLSQNLKKCFSGMCDEKNIEFTPKLPKQIINYVSAHDNLTLWDKLVISNNIEPNFKEKNEFLIKQNKLAIGLVFAICGIPFFQAGEEFARTKEGDENSYKSDAKINQLDWQRAKEFTNLVNYYKELIKIRKQLPILCNPNNDYIKEINFLDNNKDKNNENTIALMMQKTEKCKQNWDKIIIIANPHNEEKSLALPNGKWEILFNERECVLEVDAIKIESISICILGSKM